MSLKPFDFALAQNFMSKLVELLKTEPTRFVIVQYSPSALLAACYGTLPHMGWLWVVDRSGEPDKPIPLGEKYSKPEVVFLELITNNAEAVAAQVRRCQAAGVVAVVVATAITDLSGAALDELEAWHNKYELCDLYVYLMQDRGDLRPLFNELLRATSVSNKN